MKHLNKFVVMSALLALMLVANASLTSAQGVVEVSGLNQAIFFGQAVTLTVN